MAWERYDAAAFGESGAFSAAAPPVAAHAPEELRQRRLARFEPEAGGAAPEEPGVGGIGDKSGATGDAAGGAAASDVARGAAGEAATGGAAAQAQPQAQPQAPAEQASGGVGPRGRR